ncbi:MAG: replicative DNA helicase [Planctomycetaceae bacterium]|jgi:replicative DNA helicase|nr:replicative DNA helicase [Planctomycetaceae bacterium]
MTSESEPIKRRKSSKKSEPVNLAAFDHAPPHNLEAERAVIGALLLNPMLCDDVISRLHDTDFYSDANRRIFKNIIDLRNDGGGIDITLLADQMSKSEELEAVGGMAYLAELMQSVHVTFHAVYYAAIVREKSLLRQLIHITSSITQEAYSPDAISKDLLNKSSQQVFELCESQTMNMIVDIKTALDSVRDYIDSKMRGVVDGIKTGFPRLDEILEGLHSNELIIIAARPSMGKTALATNIAEHVAIDQKLPVLMVSLEMSAFELTLRMICSRGRIDGEKIRKNRMLQEDHEKFQTATNELSTSPIYIDETPSRTISEIAAVARRLKRQMDLRLLVIDYIGLIEPENSMEPRQEQVSKIARRLKGLARELKIPIVCLAQLNRQAEMTKDNRPKLSHLRESGAIEQDADVVVFIHREDRYMSQEDAIQKGLLGKADIIVAKQRNGRIDDTVLQWIGEFTRFEDPTYHTVEEYNDFAVYSGNASNNRLESPTTQWTSTNQTAKYNTINEEPEVPDSF